MWPFQRDDKQRKWQCFVCGKQHTEFEEFKNHILEKHDEGRDYILCPLKRCNTPVRDVRLHFKAKHPGDKPPEKGPMKAMIWKDHKDQKGKKLKTRKPRFREGYFVSIKNNGKEMHYRSGLECEIYECLEALPEVAKYDVEPIKYGIPYLHEGEKHNYFPDLSIQYTNGEIEIWEVKPASQTWLPVNESKWKAAEYYCETRGWKFIVINETGRDKLRSKIRRSKV